MHWLERTRWGTGATVPPLKGVRGWSIRFSKGTTAYTVSGSMGVQLELSDGRRLLLGSL
ncbi:MAG: hypothetical protein ACXQT3_04805 [Methermicoccaceae archaeon]